MISESWHRWSSVRKKIHKKGNQAIMSLPYRSDTQWKQRRCVSFRRFCIHSISLILVSLIFVHPRNIYGMPQWVNTVYGRTRRKYRKNPYPPETHSQRVHQSERLPCTLVSVRSFQPHRLIRFCFKRSLSVKLLRSTRKPQPLWPWPSPSPSLSPWQTTLQPAIPQAWHWFRMIIHS